MAELRLDSSIQYLKGVGPRRAFVLEKVGIMTVQDLLLYLPRKYIDRSMIVPIGMAKPNMEVTIIGRVLGKGILYGRRKRLEVILGDDTGYIALIWFAGYSYYEKIFKKGDLYSVTGPVTYFAQNQIVHPEVEKIEEQTEQLLHSGRIIPIYPSTAELKNAGITGRVMRRLVSNALELTGLHVKDYLPEKYKTRFQLMSLLEAISSIHYPQEMSDTEIARRRLAFDELLELQYLILNMRKDNKKSEKAHNYAKPSTGIKNLAGELPFKLTPDQRNAVEEIFADMQDSTPMHRLLQGDVGCGKTVVAMIAAVYAAENKLQTAFMAPTELLAEQHYANWREILDRIGFKSVLITGSLKKAERKKLGESIKDGEIDVVFGTHALISASAEFAGLGLVIIDEQHRFGVRQRGRLIQKGRLPDTLVMTATPIPRTLAMTLYGDLDITSVRTMPPGRQPVKTIWRTATSRQEMYSYLRTRLEKDDQIFFIYPLVEKSEKLDLQAAEEEFKNLKENIFPEYKLGLVHGRMKPDVREKTVSSFKNRGIDILVATTVIEVGIDIPAATIIVIEHAERFGLSQLHQLRGRVGRGEKRGMAIAVASAPISDIAKKRLDMFQSSTDGFKIAEADLELRGPGEFFGTRQHGLPELKVANLAVDMDILPIARDIAGSLLFADEPRDREDVQLKLFLSKKLAGRQKLAHFG